jgi:hypothetical protein
MSFGRVLLQEWLLSYNPPACSSNQSPGIILLKPNKSLFKWRHYEPSIILLCVRWYCHYQLSYRNLEEMMREHGLSVDHTTVSDCVKTPVLF